MGQRPPEFYPHFLLTNPGLLLLGFIFHFGGFLPVIYAGKISEQLNMSNRILPRVDCPFFCAIASPCFH